MAKLKKIEIENKIVSITQINNDLCNQKKHI